MLTLDFRRGGPSLQRSSCRTISIAVAVAVSAALAIYLVRSEPPTNIGYSLTGEQSSYYSETFVNLTFKEFHPTGNLFTSSVVIQVIPRQDRMQADSKPLDRMIADFKQVALRFNHHESNSFIEQGGSDDPIALAVPPLGGWLMGKGTFSWAGIPQLGPFFYPFDSYVLKINPSLFQVSESGLHSIVPIDNLGPR